jgi:hypothetical protein
VFPHPEDKGKACVITKGMCPKDMCPTLQFQKFQFDDNVCSGFFFRLTTPETAPVDKNIKAIVALNQVGLQN